MDRTQKLVIEIDPQRATVVLKQEILGVISRKEICPEDLFQAIIHATNRNSFISSGLLPKGCFSVEICESGAKRYCLLCQQRRSPGIQPTAPLPGAGHQQLLQLCRLWEHAGK